MRRDWVKVKCAGWREANKERWRLFEKARECVMAADAIVFAGRRPSGLTPTRGRGRNGKGILVGEWIEPQRGRHCSDSRNALKDITAAIAGLCVRSPARATGGKARIRALIGREAARRSHLGAALRMEAS